MRHKYFVSSALIVGVVALIVHKRFIVVTVVGNSMRPTFRSGDRVLVRRIRATAVRRGDVVVAEQPHLFDNEEQEPNNSDANKELTRDGYPRSHAGSYQATTERVWTIKRIVAVPGDLVPAGLAPALSGLAGDLVPPDRLILLGDNKKASFDSRRFGFIPSRYVLGVVVRKIGFDSRPRASNQPSHKRMAKILDAPS
ncbi:S26 family signal peptidase [Nonomuraea sp. M3C6]|uniref:S26 family signal peptidase n=1 Tax=Nonomuraea marmarensis TaxID=3351344 RepID=A0ABW7AXW8_9ACTN